MPDTPDPIMVPLFVVAAAAIVFTAAWEFDGLVIPGMVNLIATFSE